MRPTCISLLTVIALIFCAGADRQPPGPQTKPSSEKPIPIYKVATPPTIDGSLDDACWKAAVPVVVDNMFGVDGPRTNPPPMVARFAWDEHFLYIGYEVLDSDLIVVGTGREVGPSGNRRPTSEEYLPEKNLDLVEFFISMGSERAFWEIHHTAANHLNNHWCQVPSADALAKVANPSIGNLSIDRNTFIPDDGNFTVARAAKLKPRPDATPSTINKSDDIDIGYTGEIRLPWAGLGMPANKGRPDGSYDLNGFELPLLAAVLNGNGGKPVYHSSAAGLPRQMFHFSADHWPRYVLVDAAGK